jgi:asparagine synthase (glutamine-hydrolysing)
MCGIAGKLYFDPKKQIDAHQIKKMTDLIAHRGPDDDGVFIDGCIGLGNRRLAIVDLSPAGHMPMSDGSKKIWITYNGEIYNFLQLKTELEKSGVKFHSHTDTEVIIELYKKHGTDCLKFLRGMFAFAIWDSEKKTLFAARDRIGKKPFKYYLDSHCFIFASELKSILANPEVKKEPDLEAIDEYLTYQYVPHPKTGFKNIYKLEPGHFLIIQNGILEKHKYWDLDYHAQENLSEVEWKKQIENKLTESIKLRLISDVPLGAHLSGGIDSSVVVALMAKISSTPVKTFSIGFQESDYNELPFARMVAQKYNTDHQEFIVEPNAIGILPKLAYHYEEPYADSSALPTWYLSELTRKHVTVALNGDGGDENFAGYSRYNAMKLYKLLAMIPAKNALAEVNRMLYAATTLKLFRKEQRFLSSYSGKPVDFYRNIIDYLDQKDKDQIYTEDFKHQVAHSSWNSFIDQYYSSNQASNWLDKVLYTDIKTYLPDDLLVKVDIASMAHSVEVRSPLLDHEFMEMTAKIPSDLKLKGKNKKYILKQLAYDLLPRECIDRPKQGFGVPLEHWFRGNLYDYLQTNLLDEKFIGLGWFKRPGIQKLIDDHKSRKQNNANQLWALLMLRTWYQTWFE